MARLRRANEHCECPLSGTLRKSRFSDAGPLLTHNGSWVFGRIFASDGRTSYRELRLELLVCLIT
jgi:hypothetical protein